MILRILKFSLFLLLPLLVIACGDGIEDNGKEDSLDYLYDEIVNKIETFEKKGYNKDTYEDIWALIDSRASVNQLNGNLANLLKEKLDIVYVKLLVEETNDFLDNDCEDRDRLMIINRELKRLKKEGEYENSVKNLRESTEAIYAVAGWDEEEYNSKSETTLRNEGNLHGMVYKYTRHLVRNPRYESELINGIHKRINDNPRIKDCPLVINGKNESISRIDNFVYSSVRKKIREYTSLDSNFDLARHKELLDLVDDYDNLEYAWKSNNRAANTENLYEMLDGFYKRNKP